MCLEIWCMMRRNLLGAVWRNETAVRSVVFMKTLSKRDADKFTNAIWMKMFYTRACIYHSWEKIKTTPNLMEVPFVVTFSFCQHELRDYLQMAYVGGQNTICFCHLLWSAFLIFVILLLATEAPFAWYGMSCTLLSVCGCAGIKIWRAKRENEEKRMH